ncbi:hypothetical protein DXG01_014296 [Tephrocybe rancida]|nr:hypothetical protein DXG01_014296 [Tephrocybe rancida]
MADSIRPESRSPTPSPQLGRRQRESIDNALQQGPRKKPSHQDPLISHGRHFGRSIHALCRVHAVINNGLVIEADLLDGASEELLSFDKRFELTLFRQILKLTPNMQDKIYDSSDEELVHIADLLQKGASGARADDTRSLKGAILDWIGPKGEGLNPPLSRHIKTDRGFQHECTGALLCPTGMDWNDPEAKAKLKSAETLVRGDEWPIFIYQGYKYDPDNPWSGAFRSFILVNAFKHIFTSPSSFEKENKATRSGNARIHGMMTVTHASIAYVATQVRFALSSSSTFSRTDSVTDSDRFYNTVLRTFHDPDEVEEVNPLLHWWNRQVFPGYEEQAYRSANPNTALARIKARRAALKLAEIANT